MEQVSWQYARRRKHEGVVNPHRYKYELKGDTYAPIIPTLIGQFCLCYSRYHLVIGEIAGTDHIIISCKAVGSRAGRNGITSGQIPAHEKGPIIRRVKIVISRYRKDLSDYKFITDEQLATL